MRCVNLQGTTTDAIQLFFFVFLPQIYKKNWMLICCFG